MKFDNIYGAQLFLFVLKTMVPIPLGNYIV